MVDITKTNEKVEGFIAGIMPTGFGLYGTEFLGVGKVKRTENALIKTNKRVLIITVPMTGSDKIIAGVALPIMQIAFNKKGIENKLKEMLFSLSLEKILEMNPRNFEIGLSEIKEVKINKFFKWITFIAGGKKYKYGMRSKKDFEKAKEMFNGF